MTDGAPLEVARPPESAGCAIGILAGVLVTLGLVAGLWQSGQPAREPATVLAEAFRWEQLPFELELLEANRDRTGAELVRLAHPDFREEIPLPVQLEQEAAGDGDEPEEQEPEAPDDASEQAPPGDERIVVEAPKDWLATVEPLATDSPPVEVIFAFYPKAAPVASMFRGRSRWGGDSEDEFPRGPQGLHREVTRDILTWGDYQANYVLERVHLPERHFRDSLRVNLSRAGAYCVLFAQWPVDHKGSAARVEELLAAFQPVEPELAAESRGAEPSR